MKITEITPNLIRLTRFGFVNAYLVREQDGFTLIDTMIRGSGKKLLAAADRAGTPIVRIMPTHAHGDHIGSLVELSRALPDAEVIVGERDGRFIHGDKSLDPGEPEGRLLGSYPRQEVEFNREVNEGDRVGSLTVFAIPGHSPGQIAMFDERDGSLIAGDSYSNIGGLASTAGPYWKMPLPGFATWDRPLALESAKKVRSLDPGVLLVGHGKELINPGPAMDRAIAARE